MIYLKMKIGDTVKTVNDFHDVGDIWGYKYPNVGDVLTISNIEPHPNKKLKNLGISLLRFVELPNLPGVCDKNKWNIPLFTKLNVIGYI